MKKSFYILLFVFALVVLGGYAGNRGFWDGKTNEYSNLKREPYKQPEQIDVTLVLVYSDDNVVTYKTKADEGDTVFNLLRTVTAKESIDLKVKKYDFGTLIESINGFENSSDKAWIYFVNDRSGDVGSDQKILEDGDEVEWRYTKPTY